MTSETPKRVLVAEDNAALAGVIRFNLIRAGFEVVTTRNGREALETAGREPFDLLLTDEQMPEMCGTLLCHELRKRTEYRSTPIIMLTAKGLELDVEELRKQLGVSATLPKPFSPAELVSLVEECLSAVSC